MKGYKKITCVLAALCLFGTALASPTIKMSAKAQDTTMYSIGEILTPIWEGDISYQESVLPVENQYGGLDPIELLYPIEEIISVQNTALTITYEKGVDYAVSGGKLIIADDGNIPTLSYEDFHPSTGQAGLESTNGGYVCFSEGDWFHSKQIVVTYKHSEDYSGFIPQGKGHLLPNVSQRLEKQADIDMLVFGDSISVGANSSGFIGAPPYMPTYAELFRTQLETAYGNNVTMINPSVGGMGVDWGIKTIDTVLPKMQALDLAVIAFGMNDGNMLAKDFAEKANQMIDKIQQKFPDAEILLVATMLPNPEAKNVYLAQKDQADALLLQCEREGVAVVNMTALHTSLLQKKRYADMTGNNVNHPNDYLARVYAQALYATLQKQAEGPKEDEEQQEAGTTIGRLLSGCKSTASLMASGVAVGCAMMALKKKKDE